MLQALVVGLIGSSALVIGGTLGALWNAPAQVTGILLAFASGSLIAALAFELFPEAVEVGGLGPSALGLFLGGLVFVVVNTDPTWMQHGWLELPLAELGLADDGT